MQQLRDRNYTVLGLSEALTRLYAGDLPPRSVAVTFDDGTRDFATIVVPMLREFDIPATLYLTTYYSEADQPIFTTAFRYLLW